MSFVCFLQIFFSPHFRRHQIRTLKRTDAEKEQRNRNTDSMQFVCWFFCSNFLFKIILTSFASFLWPRDSGLFVLLCYFCANELLFFQCSAQLMRKWHGIQNRPRILRALSLSLSACVCVCVPSRCHCHIKIKHYKFGVVHSTAYTAFAWGTMATESSNIINETAPVNLFILTPHTFAGKCACRFFDAAISFVMRSLC